MSAARLRFWLRWSGRDLRRRWLVVVAISMTIAIGTGAYAGLSSMSEWRRASNDASYEKLAFHDLRVTLNPGSSLPSGALRAAVASIPAPGRVAAVEERLVAPTQVDASSPGRTIATPGRIVGVDVGGRVAVDSLFAKRGRVLGPADAARTVAVLDYGFARSNHLPDSGTVVLAGGHPIDYVGQGVSPEYFYVTSEAATLSAEANFAVVYMPLATAQALTGQQGRINDAVLRLAPGADAAAVRRDLQRALAARLPDVGASVLTRRDNDGYRILYDDISGDQEIYNIFALILLGAGTFAAFNLASRIIESQRRELGVGMALGVPPRSLAIRPLLLGVQIAVLGVVLGIPFGLFVGRSFLAVLKEALPLPVWTSPFQPGVFARGAVLGIVLPILATAYPTVRAIRMPPVQAVQAGFRAARGAGLAGLATRVPLPGRTLARMPLRNLLRAPRRTLLTVLGIAAAVTTAVGVTGMIDSFVATIDESRSALVGPSSDRMAVNLAGFVRQDAPSVAQIAGDPRVAAAEPAVVVPATVGAGTKRIDVALEVMDAGSALFRPALSAGHLSPGGAGILITKKAASDLGVSVGDPILLRHPVRVGPTALRMADSTVRVAGLVPNPLRVYAYMDRSQAGLLNLAGLTNRVNVEPKPGMSIDALKRSLLRIDVVASADRVAAASEALNEALSQYNDILRIVELVAFALALLIAFNSASIAADERAREYATMFAFGVPMRTVLRNAMAEGAVAGALATVVGVAGGLLVIRYIVEVTTPRVIPDLGAIVSISTETILLAALLGVVAATLAPLLTIRKLSRMDVPSTLRVVE